jgi:PIN domain nuclease of toxin-antitoxin system
MRFLLDTHVLPWWRDASPLLSSRASAEIAAGENEVLVSIASLWEITIKRSLGKLAFAEDFEAVLNEERFGLLGIISAPAAPGHAAATAPQPVRPFIDRAALAEDVPVVTGDAAFAAYGTRLIW